MEELHDPIEGLDIKEGWCCGEDDCRVSSISLKYVENHCRNAHGNEAFKRKAWFGCHMQTLLGHPNIRSMIHSLLYVLILIDTFESPNL